MSFMNVTGRFCQESVEREVQTAFHLSMEKLTFFWKEFGISEEQISERSKAVVEHSKNLFSDLVKEEEELYESIKKNIKSYETDLEHIALELDVEVNKPEDHLPLVQKEKILRTQLDELTQERNFRIEKYKQMRKTESRLCDMLGMPKNNPSFSAVPKKQELYELEQHIHMLSDERERRYKKFCSAKQQLSTILEETDFSPETSFEREVICYDEDEDFVLSQENLDQLKKVVEKVTQFRQEMENEIKKLQMKLTALWDRLNVDQKVRDEFMKQHCEIRRSTVLAMEREIKACEEIKKQNIASYIETLRKELLDLWDKCFISTSERQLFEPFFSKEYDEDLLQLHDAEVDKLKKYYEDTRDIFQKINRRQELWDMMLVFERKAQDPNRYTNRGGNLLQEERQRNKLLKELPRLEVEILSDIGKYEEKNDTLFLVNGIDFSEFIRRQWEEHQKEKENERLERQKQRSMMMDSGSMKTPSKRPMFGTPSTTPGKLLRGVNGTLSASRSTRKAFMTPQHTTLSSAPPSCRKNLASTLRRSSRFTTPKTVKPGVLTEKNHPDKKYDSKYASSNNTTTYTDFASEMNKESRERCRSSVVHSSKKAPKKVLGSKINHSGSLRRSRSLCNSSSSRSRSRSSKILMKSNKSIRNTPRTPTKLTPARGKLGLPFLI